MRSLFTSYSYRRIDVFSFLSYVPYVPLPRRPPRWLENEHSDKPRFSCGRTLMSLVSCRGQRPVDVSHNVTLLITGPQSQNIRHAATAVFLGGKLRNRIKVILFIALHSPWSPGIGLGWRTLLGWSWTNLGESTNMI